MKKILFIISITFLSLFMSVDVTFAQKNNQAGTKAVLGIVEHIKENSLRIHDKKEGTTEAEITDKTRFIGRDKKILKFNDIKEKDIVAIVGSESGKFASNGAKLKQALKIFVKESSTAAQLKRRAISGLIKSINGSIITLVHPIHQEQSFTLLTNNQTIIKFKGKISKLSSLTTGMRIVGVGELNDQGVLVAKLIHVIPGLAKGLFNKTSATPSATLTPSITATPTATLTSTPSATPSPTL